MTTTVYVDAFNLDYGALRGSAHKWLDLDALSHRLLPKDEINRIRYFTARITARPDDPQQAQRQETYLRALRTLPVVSIHYGHFLTHTLRMPLAHLPRTGPRTVEVVKTEEKGSDVNLASHLLLDAFQKASDVAVVISQRLRSPSADPNRRTRAWDPGGHHQPSSTRVPLAGAPRDILQATTGVNPG